jgi:glyoxylase-like metal-dependent hydrolase (beta-lactamase superfamily II)
MHHRPAKATFQAMLIAGIAAVSFAIGPASAHTTGSEAKWLAQAERDWKDLPAAAQDQPIPQDKGYLSREVAPGLFVVTEGLYQAMFVVTNSGVVVVDAPPTIGAKLSAAIKDATPKPVTHFIYSHSHIDHVGAADQFKGVQRIASAETTAKLRKLGDPRRPVPTQTVRGVNSKIVIGGTTFSLAVRGNHHEPGNLYIHLPQKRVLMVVDIVYPGWVPFTNLGMAEDVQGFIDAHGAILRYDFNVFVGGHLSRPGTRADVETQKEYVDDLIAAAKTGKATVNFGQVAGEIGFANRWLLVKSYMDRVADVCSQTMIDKWAKRLAGAHVSTPGHCWIMQEHLGINGLPATARAP